MQSAFDNFESSVEVRLVEYWHNDGLKRHAPLR